MNTAQFQSELQKLDHDVDQIRHTMIQDVDTAEQQYTLLHSRAVELQKSLIKQLNNLTDLRGLSDKPGPIHARKQRLKTVDKESERIRKMTEEQLYQETESLIQSIHQSELFTPAIISASKEETKEQTPSKFWFDDEQRLQSAKKKENGKCDHNANQRQRFSFVNNDDDDAKELEMEEDPHPINFECNTISEHISEEQETDTVHHSSECSSSSSVSSSTKNQTIKENDSDDHSSSSGDTSIAMAEFSKRMSIITSQIDKLNRRHHLQSVQLRSKDVQTPNTDAHYPRFNDEDNIQPKYQDDQSTLDVLLSIMQKNNEIISEINKYSQWMNDNYQKILEFKHHQKSDHAQLLDDYKFGLFQSTFDQLSVRIKDVLHLGSQKPSAILNHPDHRNYIPSDQLETLLKQIKLYVDHQSSLIINLRQKAIEYDRQQQSQMEHQRREEERGRERGRARRKIQSPKKSVKQVMVASQPSSSSSMISNEKYGNMKQLKQENTQLSQFLAEQQEYVHRLKEEIKELQSMKHQRLSPHSRRNRRNTEPSPLHRTRQPQTILPPFRTGVDHSRPNTMNNNDSHSSSSSFFTQPSSFSPDPKTMRIKKKHRRSSMEKTLKKWAMHEEKEHNRRHYMKHTTSSSSKKKTKKQSDSSLDESKQRDRQSKPDWDITGVHHSRSHKKKNKKNQLSKQQRSQKKSELKKRRRSSSIRRL